MLNIRNVKHLARSLDTTVEQLKAVLEDAESDYEELILIDPAKPEKQRDVVCVRGTIRKLQNKLYRRVLLRKLTPSEFSHGGVQGRHVKSNVEPHRGSRFVFKTDISNFYPTIHHTRVYKLFQEKFGCSPDVSRLCTRLCTYKYHLALGLITSPFLADQILYQVDNRIGAVCRKAGLVYTRFVDDVTISGQYDMESSGFEKVVTQILNENGFGVNTKKNEFSPIGKETSITGIRIVKGGRLDVRQEYVSELERKIEDAKRLANKQQLEGSYYTPEQIRGRVEYVRWINPRRGQHLLKKYNSVSWDKVTETALELELVATKKILHKKNDLAGLSEK